MFGKKNIFQGGLVLFEEEAGDRESFNYWIRKSPNIKLEEEKIPLANIEDKSPEGLLKLGNNYIKEKKAKLAIIDFQERLGIVFIRLIYFNKKV